MAASPSGTAHDAFLASVPARLSRRELAVVLIGAIGLGGGILGFLLLLAVQSPTTLQIVLALAVSVVIATSWVVGFGRLHVTNLSLSTSQARLSTWFQTEVIPLSALRPPRSFSYAANALFLVSWMKPSGRPSGSYILSREQARALLSHPSFPAKCFPDGAWILAGLTRTVAKAEAPAAPR